MQQFTLSADRVLGEELPDGNMLWELPFVDEKGHDAFVGYVLQDDGGIPTFQEIREKSETVDLSVVRLKSVVMLAFMSWSDGSIS